MTNDDDALARLIAKDAIRELALLYCRGVDRQDFALLRTLYAQGATDSHDVSFDGPAEAYVDFLAASVPHLNYGGHHVCNHLISVDLAAGTGEGEVYAIAWHIVPDRAGGWYDDIMSVRYIDHYVIEAERWKFARRVVRYDARTQRPTEPHVGKPDPLADPSYAVLKTALFART